MTPRNMIDEHLSDPCATLDTEQRLRTHSSLLNWYTTEGRHQLPWRHTRDPYGVLVSEIMLQQTQVERVLPKYISFLAQFPTLAILASAPTAEIIKAWAGLGYNMRAVRLQEIARQAVAKYDGTLPATLDELLTLKGIGRYTAGAIACFAFETPVATVDTNIRRVLWRTFRGIEPGEWPTGERASREVLALAEWALPVEQAYDWQQALMDLGATVCLSRRPLCERCPLTECCAAYAETAQATLFPSGEALARLRDERMAHDNSVDAENTVGTVYARNEGRQHQQHEVAEADGTYQLNAGNGGGTKAKKRSKNGKKREPFEQSSRYFRGRVVEALRTLAPDASLSLVELGPLIRPDFVADDPVQLAWLHTIAKGLIRDGLARLIAPESSDHAAAGADANAPNQTDTPDIGTLRLALP